MRCLHLYSGNLYGGIESFLASMARHRSLCPEMEPHFAICFQDRLHDELIASGAHVHWLGKVRLSRPWTVRQARRQLRELLDQIPFDIVCCHACWSHAVFAPVVQSRRLPLVFWAHDVPTGTHWLERRARRFPPDHVLANSCFTQSFVHKLFAGVLSHVVYLPVPAPSLSNRDEVRRKVRVELDTPPSATVIIQASRLERWKGHALLLDALGQLNNVPGWVCWIAGGAQRALECAYLSELQCQARRLGISDRVKWLGQRSDVAFLLAAADIHCQLNTSPEPFGVALVEALYAGLPVVTTNMGGAQEIIDSTCGVLVSADAFEIAEALKRLISDPRERRLLGHEGPLRAASLCDPVRQLQHIAERLSGISRANGQPATQQSCREVQCSN